MIPWASIRVIYIFMTDDSGCASQEDRRKGFQQTVSIAIVLVMTS
jgi:hypothetical protein